jgi:hypothetical protein
LLLIISLLSLPDPWTEAKEAVIFKQISQMARVMAYLHVIGAKHFLHPRTAEQVLPAPKPEFLGYSRWLQI